MSVFDTVGKLFSGAVQGAEDVAGLATKVWGAFKRLWSLLDTVGGLLDGAWDWMVKGAEYIGVGMEHLVTDTAGLLWGLVDKTIPALAAWAYRNSIGWAWKEIVLLSHAVHRFVDDVIKWAQRELHRLERLLLGWVHHIIHWAQSAVWWVEHRAETVWHLLTHPDALAQLLAAHVVWPVVKWLLHSGSKIVVYLLKQAAHDGSEIEHFFEDILGDML